jgi:hypothetical protein
MRTSLFTILYNLDLDGAVNLSCPTIAYITVGPVEVVGKAFSPGAGS